MRKDLPFGCRTCRNYPAYARGCCRRCYKRWRAKIAAGQTTWLELERQEKAVPLQRDRQRQWGWRGG